MRSVTISPLTRSPPGIGSPRGVPSPFHRDEALPRSVSRCQVYGHGRGRRAGRHRNALVSHHDIGLNPLHLGSAGCRSSGFSPGFPAFLRDSMCGPKAFERNPGHAHSTAARRVRRESLTLESREFPHPPRHVVMSHDMSLFVTGLRRNPFGGRSLLAGCTARWSSFCWDLPQ